MKELFLFLLDLVTKSLCIFYCVLVGIIIMLKHNSAKHVFSLIVFIKCSRPIYATLGSISLQYSILSHCTVEIRLSEKNIKVRICP